MSLSGSGKLAKQIEVELEQLTDLLESHRSLIIKCADIDPDSIERSAMAAMLHSFYSGIENIFKRIQIESGEAIPHGESWHRDLLNRMRAPGENRPLVLDDDLHTRLLEYLDFRHVFRQAYTFQLRWEKMKHLVLGCDEVLEGLKKRLARLVANRK